MELLAPILGLGGLFIYSNRKKSENGEEIIEDNIKEGMANNSSNDLVNNIPDNFPILQPVKQENVNKFSQPNATTDQFFRPSVFYNFRNGPDQFGGVSKEQEFRSLTGDDINKADFKHNNMTPYFGARIRGRTNDANLGEAILDNMVGSGSQQFTKTERAPLFKPQAEMQFAHGTPNFSEFYESRVNPSQRMANVKTFQSEQVGPGLNQGYTNKGSGGFNSGMEARDAWVGPNVDELRVKTNPKISYGLANHEGPANNWIKNAPTTQTQGKVEKYNPDTYFINTPDRWLTTTGLEKAQTVRSETIQKDVNRISTTEEYYGASTNLDGNAHYINGEVEASKRQQLDCEPMGAVNMTTQNQPSTGDYGRDGYNVVPNNRCHTNSERMGGIGGILKSTFAPVLDVLRPTRKENVVGNYRIYGDASSSVSRPTVFNPADRAPTTIRETTEGGFDEKHLNVQGQNDGAYIVSKQTPITNERDTTCVGYNGNGGFNKGPTTYNAAYNQRNNVNKTYANRPNQGGTSLLNNEVNVKIHRNENDRKNNRWGVPNGGVGLAIPSVETHGKMNMPQYYDNCMSCERINPDILTAFKENPYTQSLNSF